MLSRREKSPERRNRRQARYVETLGLIVIALMIIAITLARYARQLSWSWR